MTYKNCHIKTITEIITEVKSLSCNTILPRILWPIMNIWYYNNKGLTEEYMIIKTRVVMMFKKSKDPKLKIAGIEVRTGRRWNASLELQITGERLRHKPLVGRVDVGRTGLGYCTSKDIRRATGEEYRHLLKN